MPVWFSGMMPLITQFTLHVLLCMQYVALEKIHALGADTAFFRIFASLGSVRCSALCATWLHLVTIL